MSLSAFDERSFITLHDPKHRSASPRWPSASSTPLPAPGRAARILRIEVDTGLPLGDEAPRRKR